MKYDDLDNRIISELEPRGLIRFFGIPILSRNRSFLFDIFFSTRLVPQANKTYQWICTASDESPSCLKINTENRFRYMYEGGRGNIVSVFDYLEILVEIDVSSNFPSMVFLQPLWLPRPPLYIYLNLS